MDMRFNRLAPVAALALAALFAGSAGAREVETIRGAVTIPDAPARILVLNPALAGTVASLGLDILAVTETTRAPTEEGYSRFWADIAREAGTKVLPWNFDGFDLELIQSYEPDLIIAGGQGRPGFLAIEAYEQLTVIAPTLLVDTAIGTWQGQLDFLSDALDRGAEAEAVLASYAQKVEAVKAAIALPPQPTAFLLRSEKTYFLPEGSATPQLFADIGFTLDPLMERFPDFRSVSTGDSIEVTPELIPDVFSAPTLIVVPWAEDTPGVEALKTDPVFSFLPAIQSGNAYDVADYAYRFDYYAALAVLDEIAAAFAK